MRKWKACEGCVRSARRKKPEEINDRLFFAHVVASISVDRESAFKSIIDSTTIEITLSWLELFVGEGDWDIFCFLSAWKSTKKLIIICGRRERIGEFSGFVLLSSLRYQLSWLSQSIVQWPMVMYISISIVLFLVLSRFYIFLCSEYSLSFW